MKKTQRFYVLPCGLKKKNLKQVSHLKVKKGVGVGEVGWDFGPKNLHLEKWKKPALKEMTNPAFRKMTKTYISKNDNEWSNLTNCPNSCTKLKLVLSEMFLMFSISTFSIQKELHWGVWNYTPSQVSFLQFTIRSSS